MKTIAITIEEVMLSRIDRIVRTSNERKTNRSLLIRLALGEYIERIERIEKEERDREILAAHRDLLERQVEALVAEQAEP